MYASYKKYITIVGLYILSIVVFFLCFFYSDVHGAVTINVATGGTGLSANRANNASAPTWTTLGNIRITEGVNSDISGHNIVSGTIILTAPAGWIFRAGSGTISFTAGRDITAAVVSTTNTTITMTFSTNASPYALDTITLSAIQVRALTGSNITASGMILRTSGNPGTYTVVGITNNTTNFGQLWQVTGSLSNLEIIMPGQSRGGAGVGVLGTPSNIFPNLPFVITDIKAVDQFDNIVNTFTGNKTLTYSGVLTASGANTVTNPVLFVSGDSTTTLNTTLRTPGYQRFVIRSGNVVTGTGSYFTVYNGTYRITAPSSFDLGLQAASPNITNINAEMGEFTIEDQKGFTSGYYTTLQCTDFINTWGEAIPTEGVQISATSLYLLSGSSNPSVTLDGSIDNTFTACSSPITFISRGPGGGGIFSQHGSIVSISVDVPGRQSVGLYTGSVTYTLIEN